MRSLVLHSVLLLVLSPSGSLAAECGDPPYEGHCLIANGSAPPTADNVLDDGTYSANAVWVRNVGCPPGWPAATPDADCASPGASTRADLVAGGQVGYLVTDDDSEAVVSGGFADFGVLAYGTSSVRVTGGATGGAVEAHESSEVRMYGGSAVGVAAYDSATAIVHGGSPTSVAAFGSSRVRIDAGSFETAHAGGDGTVEVAGGTLDGAAASSATETATLDISGGVVSSPLAVRDSAEIVIRGGTVTGALGAIEPASLITVVGWDFALNGGPTPFGVIQANAGTLTGRLTAGGSIHSLFGHSGHTGVVEEDVCYLTACYGTIQLVEATPLPALSLPGVWALGSSLLLAGGLGSRLLRRQA